MGTKVRAPRPLSAIFRGLSLATSLLFPLWSTAWAQSAEPLLQQQNLVYQGAFRLPQTPCIAPTYACFSYGGTALAYDQAHNGLFIVGHPYGELTAEVSIPTPVNATTLSALNTATVLQPFADATSGLRNSVNPTDPNAHDIGGELVYDGRLIVSVYSYYDGSGTQTSSHFVHSVNLSASTPALGPFTVGSQYPGFVSGYMASIPPEWQSLFSGPALTGNCCLAITSKQSDGPAASVFDPSQLGVSNPTPATPIVGYPYAHPLGTGWRSQSTEFNGTTQITGIVFAAGTRSVLFFGRQGIGPFCYGSGTSQQSLVGTLIAPDDPWCYDPADSAKGTHAYPYLYTVWAYDANDLLAVKSGEKQQYEISPYAVWTFHMPFETSTSAHTLGGAAYDPQHGLIYISQICADSACNPIIQVFKIDENVPDPPTSLQVQ